MLIIIVFSRFIFRFFIVFSWRMFSWYFSIFVKNIAKKLLGRTSKEGKDPEMQMNPYNVGELLFLMQSAGIHDVYLEFTDHGGEWGISTYFQKPRRSLRETADPSLEG